MNKKEFLKQLQQKLYILDEKEINDIITEYSDIIEEKIKNGKDEIEAVSEFGSVEELSSEILKAYKINPKYTGKSQEGSNDYFSSLENWIKDTAKVLSNIFRDIYENIKKNNKNISIDFIFELIIKFIIMLVILAILTLPFGLINRLGDSILSMTFYPLNRLLSLGWDLTTSLLYLGICILVFISMFKEYISFNSNNAINNKSKSLKKKIVSKSSKAKEETSNICDSKIDGKINDTTSIIKDIIKFFYKLFMVLVFIIPFSLALVGFIIALGIIIYYVFVGIEIWGGVVLFIGLIIGLSWLIDITKQLTFGIKKIEFTPVFTSLILTCIGGLTLVNNITSFDYINEIPKTDLISKKTEIKELEITKLAPIEAYNSNIKFTLDDEIENNYIKMEVNYYNYFREIERISLDYDHVSNTYNVNIEYYNYSDFNNFKTGYNLLLNYLKDNKIYNYSKLEKIEIIVYANSETIKQLSKV